MAETVQLGFPTDPRKQKRPFYHPRVTQISDRDITATEKYLCILFSYNYIARYFGSFILRFLQISKERKTSPVTFFLWSESWCSLNFFKYFPQFHYFCSTYISISKINGFNKLLASLWSSQRSRRKTTLKHWNTGFQILL